jgi:hypothetical protein
MFSTIDSVKERTVVARVRLSGESIPVRLDAPYRSARDRLQAQPTVANAERLARLLLDSPWDSAADGQAARPAPGGERPVAVRIEVRRIHFASATNELSSSTMLALDVQP